MVAHTEEVARIIYEDGENDKLQAPEANEENEADEQTVPSSKAKKRNRKKKTAQMAPVELAPGIGVIIQGLTGATELNGKEGTCEQWDSEKARWHVKLQNGEVKALKPDNLKAKVAAVTSNKACNADAQFVAWCQRALDALPSGAAHLSVEDRLKTDDEDFANYKFSGSLRPAFVTPQMDAPRDIMQPDYALDPEGVAHSEKRVGKRGIIPVLEGEGLQTMRDACQLGREVLDIAAKFMREGVTGDEIDRIVFQACIDRKIYPSPLNYFGFPKSLCVSPNEVICHGIPDCRPLREGDIVNLDISIYHKGYHADLNETFFIGKCDTDSHKLVRAAYDALKAAATMIRPGTMYRDLGGQIHAVAVEAGCAVVPAYCGHGVGQLFHGPPDVPHYKKNKAVGIMKPGHVFTIEPMLNLGGNGGDTVWPDSWTAVTRDGQRSAQFEHTFLVTETGYEILTARKDTDRFSMPSFDAKVFQK